MKNVFTKITYRKYPDVKVLYINRSVAFQNMGFPLSAIHDAAVSSML